MTDGRANLLTTSPYFVRQLIAGPAGMAKPANAKEVIVPLAKLPEAIL